MDQQIKVFKFGGASVQNADRIKMVKSILEEHKSSPVMVVVSAMGKMTNALEKVARAYFNKEDTVLSLLDEVKNFHLQLMSELFENNDPVYATINDTLVEIEWMLDEDPGEDYDYVYDQMVSVGELLSSKILSAFLNNENISNHWLDARDIIQTDNTYREAKVLWKETKERAEKNIKNILSKQIIITQGFIGSSSENFTTTLGREGSDYTAAIFSYCLDAEGVYIWKDVKGILTGDPTLFQEVEKLGALSYREAIEMTYYGAKVIHPKTIKPLQNKKIPLYVKCFLDSSLSGTKISEVSVEEYPPIIVVEHEQCLLNISVNDFSFVAEHHLSSIFALLAKHRIKVNLMRNTAISFVVCVNNIPARIAALKRELDAHFKTLLEENLELITIRHFDEETLTRLQKGKVILMQERLKDTVQMVVRKID